MNWVYSNFDNLNRVTKVCENGAAGCASGLLITYTLDPLSRRDAITRPNGAGSDFGYDLASRLTHLTQDVSGTTNDLSRTFTYTLASQLQTRINATAAHAFSPAPGSSAYAANGRNQYTTVAGATFSHDLNGNLTGDGARTFGYDAENRLTSVSGSASLTLMYDPLGRLRQTTAGATTTDFLYEGDRLIAEYNGSTLLRRYAHGPGIDEPIVWYEGTGLTTKRWLHPDERGSIVAWTDGAAAATVYRYGAFGEPAGNDFTGSRFRYTGQIALPEVKLYHYKARVYDPALGRFLQTDPVGYEDDFNLYAYVYNDPFNNVDPTGTLCIKGVNYSSAMCVRSMAYENVHADPVISSKTSFFGAAAIVTSALALPEQSSFMQSLSGRLEKENMARADLIRSGNLYASGLVADNDRDFIHFEQTLVQSALNDLNASDPSGYADLISKANARLNSDSTSLAGPWTDPNFAKGLAAAREELGGTIDFASQEHREALGRAIANIARSSASVCTVTVTGSRITARRC